MELNDGTIFLDVRSVLEFEKGHVPGAVNIPIMDYSVEGERLEPNTSFLQVCNGRFSSDTPLIVGCAAGARSLRAAHALESARFTNVVNMVGGFSGKRNALGEFEQLGWVQEELPVSHDPSDGESYASILAQSIR